MHRPTGVIVTQQAPAETYSCSLLHGRLTRSPRTARSPRRPATRTLTDRAAFGAGERIACRAGCLPGLDKPPHRPSSPNRNRLEQRQRVFVCGQARPKRSGRDERSGAVRRCRAPADLRRRPRERARWARLPLGRSRPAPARSARLRSARLAIRRGQIGKLDIRELTRGPADGRRAHRAGGAPPGERRWLHRHRAVRRRLPARRRQR